MSIKKRRILAASFDYVLLLAIISGLSFIPIKIWMGRVSFNLSFFIGMVVLPAYIAFKDLVFRNASLGKQIFGLKIVNKETLRAPSAGIIIVRNVLDIVPIFFWVDMVMVIMGEEKFSDKWFKTAAVLKNRK